METPGTIKSGEDHEGVKVPQDYQKLILPEIESLQGIQKEKRLVR